MPSRDRRTERAKVQEVVARRERERRETGAVGVSEPLTQLERDGELLWVMGDAERHERRILRAIKSGWDRVFWVTLAIACGAPGIPASGSVKGLEGLAKRYGKLAKARNDLDAFYEYYRPMLLGDPHVVCPPEPGLLKSPGFFDCAVRLDNPTVGQLVGAIHDLRDWVEVNQDDQEYVSFQLNFCFSGHGDITDGDRPGLVLADATLEARDLASLLLQCIPEQETKPNACRLDLYLDCCHSGAIARGIHLEMARAQKGTDPAHRSVLALAQAYCACLDDEESFELDEVMHSVFTFAFLNECSRKQPDGAASTNLGLRDVGWFTEGRQHPLLLDLTVPEGWAMKFPSRYYLTHPPVGLPAPPPVALSLDLARLERDVVGESLRLAKEYRARCIELEREMLTHPESRIPFSRDEILTNKRFPFL